MNGLLIILEVGGAAFLAKGALNLHENAATRRANATGLLLNAANQGRVGDPNTTQLANELVSEASADDRKALLFGAAALALGGYAAYSFTRKR